MSSVLKLNVIQPIATESQYDILQQYS